MTDPELSDADVARYWNANADGCAAEVRQGHDVAREWLNNPEFLPFIGDVRGRQGIRYVNTSYAALDMFDEAAFDTVVSFMALMDGPRFDLAMKECCRVLRPGGTLAFSLMHPCFITKGSRWIRDEHGEKVSWVVSRYFDPGHWVERWRFTDAPADAPQFAVPRFDRTLSEYLNAVMDAGFTLRKLGEPRPSLEYCAAHPSQRGWRDHVAVFLHVRAEKP